MANQRVPQLLLRTCGSHGWCAPFGGYWLIETKLEPNKQDGSAFPHVAAMTPQPVNARDSSILYGELAVILTVLYGCVYQVEAETEEMEEVQEWSRYETERACRKSPALLDEEEFPVLLCYFVGPQHARILCAQLDGTELVNRIRCPIASKEGTWIHLVFSRPGCIRALWFEM